MDVGVHAFRKHEHRLQRLTELPSDIVRRQIRITPHALEDVSWIAAGVGEEVVMFGSDYPHVEGGRDPLNSFERSMRDMSPAAKQRFYCDNFVDLMGSNMPLS
jgi:predicted TIM-barrel fold metal-dependent hydrolase